ncbi:unnamed protein product [Ectocarpus sp. 12 AP-2014]
MKASRASPELVLKVLLVGAPKAGKTSLVRRMCDKAFREDYVQTLGFDVTVVPYGTYQGRPVKLHLWDVAGSQLTAQPCHHGLIAQGAEGVLYVMDVTSRESLQAVDDWDQALSQFYPPWTCKLLVGHKADLPAYVVNDEALSLYVAGASGFKGWCLTVGSSEYGDYDVAARRGGGSGATAHGTRHKGQSLSGEKQLSVSEAVRTLLGHVFRSGGAARGASRPAGVLGLGASAGRATPLPSDHLQDALETMELLGLGDKGTPPVQDENSKDGDTEESSRGRECADWPEEERSGDGSKGRPVEMRSEGLGALLERGRGPDPSWRQGVPGDGLAVATVGDDDANGGDPGWRHFAGRMGREEAEALLRGRPDGTFFLRRKGPSLLVLTYVASAMRPNSNANTPTSGARNLKSNPASRSPRMRDMLGSPQGEKPGKGLSSEGVGDCLAGSTLVQHALLVHEGGFFSDEKGRLGRFSTLEEILKSKISAIARHPLSFRRERDGYVLIDEDDPTALSHQPAPSTASTDLSPSTNTFARADKAASAHDRIIRGNPASSLAPTANGNLFGPGSSRLGAAAVDATSSPPSSPPVSLLSPRAGNAGAENPFDKALRRRRPNTTAESGSTTAVSRRVTGDWTDSRVPGHGKPNARRGGSVANSGAGSSSAGGSLWMEAAAAAVEQSGPAAVVAAPSRNVTGVSNVSGLPHGHSLSSDGGTAVASGSFRGTGGAEPLLDSRGGAAAGRGGAMKWSGSAVDDAGARGSMSSPSSIVSDVRGPSFRQQQHQPIMKRSGSGRRDTTSAMAEAAEAAAVMAAARGHPDVRRVEERTRSAQAGVDRAAAVLEQRLRPLVARKTPMHSPLQRSPRHSQTSSSSSADFRGFRRTSPPPSSSFSSSRDVSPRSLDLSSAPLLGREPQQRWIAAAPEGSVTAPLAAAAALLMERACACRRELAVSAHELNERAVALAVAETTSSAAGSLAAATSDRTRGVGTRDGGGGDGMSASESSAAAVGPSNEGSGSPVSPSRSFLRGDGRQRFLTPAGVVVGNGNRSGNEISVGGVQGNQPPTTLSAPLQGRQTAVGGTEAAVTTAAPARPDGGLAGMSCCVDFERILGYEEADNAAPGERSPFVGDRDREAAAAASSAFRVDAYPDRGRRLSDSSMVAERSFSGSNQLSGGSVAGGLASREPRDQGNPLRIMVGSGASALGVDVDEWATVLRDLEIAEDRGREFVDVWEAAGGALKNACDDLAFEEDEGRGLAGGLLSQ